MLKAGGICNIHWDTNGQCMHLIKCVCLHQTTIYPHSTKAVSCPHIRSVFKFEQTLDSGPQPGIANGAQVSCTVYCGDVSLFKSR